MNAVRSGLNIYPPKGMLSVRLARTAVLTLTARQFCTSTGALVSESAGKRATAAHVSVSAAFDLERVKLVELDRRLPEQPGKWFLKSDKDWYIYSRPPVDDAGPDPAAKMVCCSHRSARRDCRRPSRSKPPRALDCDNVSLLLRFSGSVYFSVHDFCRFIVVQASHVAISKRGPMVLVNCHDKDAAVFDAAARIPTVSIPLKCAERLVESKQNYHQ